MDMPAGEWIWVRMIRRGIFRGLKLPMIKCFDGPYSWCRQQLTTKGFFNKGILNVFISVSRLKFFFTRFYYIFHPNAMNVKILINSLNFRCLFGQLSFKETNLEILQSFAF